MSKRLCAVFFSVIMLSFLLLPGTAAEGEQLVYNFAFDNETEHGAYFSLGGSVTSEWVNNIGRNDTTAIKMTHIPDSVYTSSENFLRLTLPEPLSAGGVYRVVVWVYAPSSDNMNKSTLTGPGIVLNGNYWGEQGESKFPVDFGTLPIDEWKGIDVTLPMQEMPVETLDFRIVINDEPNHPDVWYWDNIEIYQVGGLTDVETDRLPTETEEGYPILRNSNGGTIDGFDYELWNQRRGDNISMILSGGGTYRCDWDAQNVLFRTGKKLGSEKTYQEYGNVTVDYAANYTITKGDVSYLCVYGWTEDPMIEYYILESYGNYKPPGGKGFVGTYEIDGSTYELYTDTRVQQPSIQGTKTFEQYFGIRVDKRTKGTIPVSEHFKAWDEMGLDMSGKMYEISLCVEGYNSAGNAEVYEHVLTIGDTMYGAKIEEDEPSPAPTTAPETATPTPITPAPTPDTDEVSTSETGVDESNNLIIPIVAVTAVIAGVAVFFIVMRKRRSQ